jgi:adenylate cyclase class 2
MSVEVESKFRVSDFSALEQKLAALGAEPIGVLVERDQYFNAPDRDFARTDEALRIRCVGSENRLTYKGPKRDLVTKTRTEIELPVGEGPATAELCADLLTHLGYRAVAIVEKTRRSFGLLYNGFQMEICLDTVRNVGQFAEVEIVTTEEQLEPARRCLLTITERLELRDSERRSYLEMLLATEQTAQP